MKYLKFITQKIIDPFHINQMTFTFVLSDTLEKTSNYLNSKINSITVGIAGREEASILPKYNNYNLEPALFTIAKNYLVENVSEGKEIKEKEEILLDAGEYLDDDSNKLDTFHTNVIEVKES